MRSNTASLMDDQGRSSNAGWVAGFVVIAVTCAIFAVLWFTYHP